MRNPESHSSNQVKVKWWAGIAVTFTFSAFMVSQGDARWYFLTIAVGSGLLLTIGAGYVVVRGLWWITVALVAKIAVDVKKRIEEAPWHITEQRRAYVRSEQFAQHLAAMINDYRSRKSPWWWPKPLRFTLSHDDMETVVGMAIGWGLSGHNLEKMPGQFGFHQLAKFMLQHQDEVESILPEVMGSVRALR
jgi:hypothetical protein